MYEVGIKTLEGRYNQEQYISLLKYVRPQFLLALNKLYIVSHYLRHEFSFYTHSN